ncbi:MAG: hypothetical protein M3Y91_18970 [Actinomycetota bacterium]|nr:hypothetical protein [Actinomycetota bacterium]
MRAPRRDHYLTPVAADDTDTVIDAAIDSLGTLRGLPSNGDAATRLHLLASLTAETDRRLPQAVAAARGQGCSWAEIGDLTGVTRASAQQRYGPRSPPHVSNRLKQ